MLIDPTLVESFSLSGQQGLQVHALRPADLERLDAALQRSLTQPAPGAAVMPVSLLVSPTMAGCDAQALDALAGLARRLAALPTPARPVHLNLVTTVAPVPSTVAERTQAALTWAALQALALVLPQETPGLTCTAIGVHCPDPSWTGAALAPLLRTRRPGPLRVDREGIAVADVRSLAARPAPPAPVSLLGKTFVITGASGRVGRAMARTIASRYGGKLALLTRRSAQADDLLALKEELESLGAGEVMLCSGSLHDVADMRDCLQRIHARMGPIHMVLHAAGVVDGASFAPLQQMTGAHLHEQLLAKAVPATVLAQIAEELAISHCVMVSSMSVFFGGIAHAAYATANAFLDEWCRLANQAHSRTQWTCVNWDTIHFDEPAASSRPEAWGQNEVALPGERFAALFEQSLLDHPDEPHLIASAGQFMRRMRDWGGHGADRSEPTDTANPAMPLRTRPERLSSTYVAPRDDAEAALVQIWEAILGVSGIGVEDSFVELGGNSLRTVVMAERVHARMGLRISLQAFVARPTIAAIVQETHTPVDADEESAGTVQTDPLAPILASEDQEMIHVYQSAYADGTYNMPVAFRCPAELPLESLANALQALLDRHVALRCVFRRSGDTLSMMPQPQPQMAMDIRPAGLGEGDARAAMQRFAAQPFALERELPIRAMLLPAGPDAPSHRVVVVVHHIVCDAVSLAILSADLMALLQGQALAPHAYDFAHARLRAQQPASARANAQAYWRANLLPLPPSLELGGGDASDAPANGRGRTARHMLSTATSARLRALCDELGVPPFVLFMAAFGAWLSRVTHCDAFLLGVPVAGRRTVEDAKVVGYLVNLVPIKVELEMLRGLAENALALQAQWSDSAPYQHYPVSALVDDLRAEPYCRRRRGRHPLFDVAFNFLPRELSSGEDAAMGGFQRIELEANSAKFDLELEVSEHDVAFECTFQLREGALPILGETAALDAFVALLDAACADPDAELLRLCGGGASSADVPDVDMEFNF
ncbi:MAG: SDR family NAD(P)-dependent oxidoreductase [Xanthomonas sp.]